ncbi:hypothetical protein, partial [Xanthomonas nasturtii]
HARTFFHILAHQVFDLAGRNVGIHQNLTPFFDRQRGAATDGGVAAGGGAGSVEQGAALGWGPTA